jgi:DNA-binding transcriptional ArsR family regulator
MPPPAGERDRVRLLAAAGDPIRYRILALVLARPRTVGELCETLGMAQPRVSHHLALLRRSGLLIAETRGRYRLHRRPGPGADPAVEQVLSLLERWVDTHPAPVPSPATDARASLEDFLL